MNDLLVSLALDPVEHFVVRRQHPQVDQYRYSCICGEWSPWMSGPDEGWTCPNDEPYLNETFVIRDEPMVRLRNAAGEVLGVFSPGCPTCDGERERVESTGKREFGPSHHASVGCKSGKRPHCTCDGCF